MDQKIDAQVEDADDIDVVMPQNMAILIQKHSEVYGNTMNMNQLLTIITISLIFLMTKIIVLHLKLKKKEQGKQEIMAQKMLK